MFKEMREKGMKPDVVTFNTLIDIHGKSGKLQECELFFADMKLTGIQPDEIVCNTMIAIFDKAGDTERCIQLAKEADKAGFVSHNAKYDYRTQ
jgi:pentatricopeptide repeat protein